MRAHESRPPTSWLASSVRHRKLSIVNPSTESNPTKEAFLPATLKGWIELLGSFGISATAVSAFFAHGLSTLLAPVPSRTAVALGIAFGLVVAFGVLVWRWKKKVQASLIFPFRVSDDYEFVPDSGYWMDRKTGLRVCGKCLFPPAKIASPLHEAIGLGDGQIEPEFKVVWKCQHCGFEYYHKK